MYIDHLSMTFNFQIDYILILIHFLFELSKISIITRCKGTVSVISALHAKMTMPSLQWYP